MTKAARWLHGHLLGKIPIVVLRGGLAPTAVAANSSSGDELLDALLGLGMADHDQVSKLKP